MPFRHVSLVKYQKQICIGLFHFLPSFKSFLYILDNSFLWEMYCANAFSHSEIHLFIPLSVSLEDQKFLMLMKFKVTLFHL